MSGGTSSNVGLSVHSSRAIHGWRGVAVGALCASVFLGALARGALRSAVSLESARSLQATDPASALAEQHRARLLSSLDALRASGAQVSHIALAPASHGWTAVFSRFEGERGASVSCVPLGRDGAQLEPVRAITTRRLAFAPSVARAGERLAVAWVEAPTDRSLPRAAWALVTERCELALSPREVSVPALVLSVAVAFNGEHVAFSTRPIGSRDAPDFSVRSLSGAVIADHRLARESFGLHSALSASNGDWFVVVDSFNPHVARTTIDVVRLSSTGEQRSRMSVRRFDGALEFVRSHTRDGRTTLYWGEDGSPFSHRFELRAASLVDGVVGPSIALSTRRTSSIASLACNDTGCSSSIVGVESASSDDPSWKIERFDRDGFPARPPSTIATNGRLELSLAPEIAESSEGDAFLSLVVQRGSVMAQRFDAEGRAQGAPRLLELR